MTALPNYEVFALRYATVARRYRDNVMLPDAHDGPMPMDYYVWLIRSENRQWLVDTGFNAKAAALRRRTLLRCPITALTLLGIKPMEIQELILSHLHYDHAGNVDVLPNARIHLQESELHFASGRYMCHNMLRHPYSVEDVIEIVRGVYDQRVEFHNGDAELAPGLQLLHIGGHTAGLQAVRVHTQRGWIVLASDASHFYANMFEHTPFPIVYHVEEMLDGHQRLLSLSDSMDHIVPGHDPLVLQCFEPYGDPVHEIVCLHRPPHTAIRPTAPLTGKIV